MPILPSPRSREASETVRQAGGDRLKDVSGSRHWRLSSAGVGNRSGRGRRRPIDRKGIRIGQRSPDHRLARASSLPSESARESGHRRRDSFRGANKRSGTSDMFGTDGIRGPRHRRRADEDRRTEPPPTRDITSFRATASYPAGFPRCYNRQDLKDRATSRPRTARFARRCDGPAGEAAAPRGAERAQGESQPMIEVINFTKHYGEFVAVDNLSFSIGKGEIFGFIGPNGAGKSTTIRFLATLLRPTVGRGPGRGLLGHRRADVRPPGHRLHAGRFRRLRRHEGLGVPRLLRRRLRDPPLVPQEDHRRGPRAARPDPQARRLRQRALQGDEAAALPGQDPGPRPPRADPRRAGLGARPAGPARDEGPAERAAADGQDDPDLQPHPLGAGRLLHVDRHHRAGQAAGGRQHPRHPAADPLAPRAQGRASSTSRPTAPPRSSAETARSAWSRPTTTP